MKARIPILTQDPKTSEWKDIPFTEGFDPDLEEFFLDGPVTRRLAVIDFDPETGGLHPPARFQAPARGKVLGCFTNQEGMDLYDADWGQLYTPEFMQVSAFATVLKTLYLFERQEVLGRHPLHWAFPSPQLLIIPRAGQMANAFYHRDTCSLQFYFFPSEDNPRETIYTCLSRDIVAHETGHALIDGIAPDLLDACSPQSLAIHEGLADLVALLVSFSSHNLTRRILEVMDGTIDRPTAFSVIAEEYGTALGKRYGLRSLVNHKTLDPQDREHGIRSLEPHLLSEVLSGALYQVMIRIHEDLKDQYAQREDYAGRPDPRYSASGLALHKGAERFQRMVFRALDYLPPGEISFADHARAMIAADLIAFPSDSKMREWVREEYLSRRIIHTRDELDAVVRYHHPALEEHDTATLQASDWAAYQFVNQHRDLFGLPKDVPFEVRPRLRVKKKYEDGQIGQECLFKVAWHRIENNPLGPNYPPKRRIQVGTTLVLDWDTGEILVRLTNAPPSGSRDEHADPNLLGADRQIHQQQRQERNSFLKLLVAEGKVAVGPHGFAPDGVPLLTTIQAQDADRVLRFQGTAKLLHIMGEEGS